MGCGAVVEVVVQGCVLIDKLPLGTRPGTYSFLHNLQYLSIPLQASLSVITLCDALRLHYFKHTPCMYHLVQIWRPLSDGRLSIFLSLKTSR